MTSRQFDIGAWIILAFIFGFAIGVSTSWNWFPDPDDRGLIANMTPNISSYAAITLPWVALLAYSLLRRKFFKDKINGSSKRLNQ
jgi:hypothetical protein